MVSYWIPARNLDIVGTRRLLENKNATNKKK